MCPKPWNLKHLLVLVGLELGLFCRGKDFLGAGVLCEVWGDWTIGLGVGVNDELPLLKD